MATIPTVVVNTLMEPAAHWNPVANEINRINDLKIGGQIIESYSAASELYPAATGCQVYKSTATTLTTGGVWYDVTPNTENWDSSEGYHAAGVITIPAGMSGYYDVYAQADITSGNLLQLRILVNGVTVIGKGPNVIASTVAKAQDIYLAAGDTIKLQAASNLSSQTVGAATAARPHLTVSLSSKGLS